MELEIVMLSELLLCYLPLLCVLKLVSRASPKILNESIFRGIVMSNCYNLEVFILMLVKKKKKE